MKGTRLTQPYLILGRLRVIYYYFYTTLTLEHETHASVP